MKNIEISEEKYEILEKRAAEKGFENAQPYVDHLLDQIIENIKTEKKNSTNEESDEIKDKLRELGYM